MLSLSHCLPDPMAIDAFMPCCVVKVGRQITRRVWRLYSQARL